MKTLNDILPLVERPSRYLGSEINKIKKDHSKVLLKFALAFPDLYEIGTSHFGIQILYNILNSSKKIAAERVFAPGKDMESYLRSSNIPITSLESRTPLIDFDIIGFSLLYELNYTNILTILDLAKIPFFARQRDLSCPLIIAGGPCTCNPEPVADFFDAIVIGDGENIILQICDAWLEWKKNAGNDKDALLKIWSVIEGVYVPSFFEAKFDVSGFQTIAPKFSSKKRRIKRAIISDLDKAPFPKRPIVPYGKPVHDRLRLEISRGCTRGCRFCQAGMIYRPVRERSPGKILSMIDDLLPATGYEDISLLSLSSGDYGAIAPLMERLMTRCEAEKIAVSFPSLRAGTLSPDLMNLIKKVRKTGFTIAPEAGSQRLRDVINKNITARDIESTLFYAQNMGWQAIKLYFMVGLPTETDGDIKAIVALVKDLCRNKNRKGGGIDKFNINVSITTFIPKPHTPFQWAQQISLEESEEKILRLKKDLKLRGVHFKWQNPKTSLLEGLWARGDRRLSRLLVSAYKNGCRFDGWSDSFRYDLWQKALSERGVDIDFFVTRSRKTDEPLPWDHIDCGIKKDFLIKEWEKAVACEKTPDCRIDECNKCGVCDFKNIEPIIYNSLNSQDGHNISKSSLDVEKLFNKFRLTYSKEGQAKYFGHLELANIFIRAVRRANIPVRFSQGFHPKPKVSFEDPLPVGIQSLCESLYIEVPGDVKPAYVISGLNNHLPEGLYVHDCKTVSSKSGVNGLKKASYKVRLKFNNFNAEKLKDFNRKEKVIILKTNKKGKTRSLDLKKIVYDINLIFPNVLCVTLMTEPGKVVRPGKVITSIFGIPEEEVKQAEIIKYATRKI